MKKIVCERGANAKIVKMSLGRIELTYTVVRPVEERIVVCARC